MTDALRFTDIERENALMQCPECTAIVTPRAQTTCADVAWYRCDECGQEWAEQLRDGKPVGEMLIRIPPEL